MLSCIYENEDFEKTYAAQSFAKLETKSDYLLLDNLLDEDPVKVIAIFLRKVEPSDLGSAIKEFIELFNQFDQINPQLDFNLPYLHNIAG